MHATLGQASKGRCPHFTAAAGPHLACWQAAPRTTENVGWAVQTGPVHRADLAGGQLKVFGQPLAGRQHRVLRDGVDECGNCWRRLMRTEAVTVAAVADDRRIRRFGDCLTSCIQSRATPIAAPTGCNGQTSAVLARLGPWVCIAGRTRGRSLPPWCCSAALCPYICGVPAK